ncbi:MAG: L,D-transpeptidase family protein [Proteobacteria bacterium]|nr:L,D-transpeptidase family protein [Pseudomonadota bacterium]
MQVFLILLLLFSYTHVFASDMVIGGVKTYVVQNGDSLELIGARHGVFWKNIAKENNIDPKLPLPEGATVIINNRKIVPKVIENGIIINIPDRTLYYFKDGRLTAIPVGVGLPYEENKISWQTTMGTFKIKKKRKNPTWYVPDSIQREMESKGKPVEEAVPPGPDNPLGRYALDTSITGILIHETIRPRSVYRYLSHGCIRVLPEHMEPLFNMVDVGTPGEIIYVPIKLAVSNNNKIYLEVRTDMYKKIKSKSEHTRRIIQDRGVADKVDWEKVDRVIKEQSGIAEDVTLIAHNGVNGSLKRKFSTTTQKILDFLGSR